jgi:tetratricopeptide (TPR) repeat protein
MARRTTSRRHVRTRRAGSPSSTSLGSTSAGQRSRWSSPESEICLGDPVAGEAIARRSVAGLEAADEAGFLASSRGTLAHAVFERGRYDEALELADETIRASAADDFEPRARAGAVRARVAARRGDFAQAEADIAEAERLATPEYLPLRAFVAVARAELEQAAGRPERAQASLKEALRLCDTQGRPGVRRHRPKAAGWLYMTAPPDRADPARFRNVSSVYLKLQNFKAVDPHEGF